MTRAFPVTLVALSLGAIAGCDKMQAQHDVPTYPDTKLDTMRAITGADLPHDPHRWREANADPSSAPASAIAATTAAPATTAGSGAGPQRASSAAARSPMPAPPPQAAVPSP